MSDEGNIDEWCGQKRLTPRPPMISSDWNRAWLLDANGFYWCSVECKAVGRHVPCHPAMPEHPAPWRWDTDRDGLETSLLDANDSMVIHPSNDSGLSVARRRTEGRAVTKDRGKLIGGLGPSVRVEVTKTGVKLFPSIGGHETGGSRVPPRPIMRR